MKRFLFAVFAVLSIFVIVMCINSCASLSGIIQEPRVSIRTVDLSKINFDGVDMICRLNVENPNAFDIPFPEIRWQLFINDNSFINGVLKNDTKLAKRGTVTVNVPFGVTYEGLFGTFASLIENNEAAYNIKLDIKFPLPILEDKTFNLDFSGSIPLFKMPVIKFSGINVKDMNMMRMVFVATWEIENKNIFALDIGEFDYSLMINNTSWAEGRLNNVSQIRPNGTTIVPLEFSINSLNLVTQIIDIVNRGSNVNFSSKGNFNFKGNYPGLENFRLPFDLSGITRLVR